MGCSPVGELLEDDDEEELLELELEDDELLPELELDIEDEELLLELELDEELLELDDEEDDDEELMVCGALKVLPAALRMNSISSDRRAPLHKEGLWRVTLSAYPYNRLACKVKLSKMRNMSKW